jgi:hypothetical protein
MFALMKNTRNQYGFAPLTLALVAALLIIVGFVSYKVYTARQSTTAINETSRPATANNSQQETISDDLVTCGVSTKAASYAGLRVAFYGYVLTNNYTEVWVEYGGSSNTLTLKTAPIPDSNIDQCSGATPTGETIGYVAEADMNNGTYYYRLAAKTKSGQNRYSKTVSFVKE